MEGPEGVEIVDIHGQEKGGVVNKVKNYIRNRVAPSTLPTERALGYKSESAFYGTKLKTDANGRLWLDYRGVVAKVDRAGDIVLRTTDDNLMRRPKGIFFRHPRMFKELLLRGPKRYRGTTEEILANIKRLGLTGRYGPYTDESGKVIGIAIKDNFIREGRTLRNMYRAMRGFLEKADELKRVDRFQAVAGAVRFIKQRHDQYGAFGEVNADDVIFTKLEGGQLKDPTFTVPDIVYNPKAAMSEGEKKAIDVIDFIVDIAEEESNIGDVTTVKKALETVMLTYGDSEVVDTVKSLILRGRLTLAGDRLVLGQAEGAKVPDLPDSFTTRQRGLFSIHNQTRFRIKEQDAITLKKMIVDVCDDFIRVSKRH